MPTCSDLNLVILLGFMGYFGAVLTLPGIAGVILTVGMGVDSNVLIFERIREELRNGKTPPSAVEQGFGHAWITIVDTHVTTIVSAAILFIFGTGPVKGFAVDAEFRSAGESVHGGVCFPRDLRLVVEPQTARRSVEHWKSVSKLQAFQGFEHSCMSLKTWNFDTREILKRGARVEFFHNPNIDFLGKKWYFLAFSLVFSVAGVFSMLFWHGIPYGGRLPRRNAGLRQVFAHPE